jgi:hypothetical protein
MPDLSSNGPIDRTLVRLVYSKVIMTKAREMRSWSSVLLFRAQFALGGLSQADSAVQYYVRLLQIAIRFLRPFVRPIRY